MGGIRSEPLPSATPPGRTRSDHRLIPDDGSRSRKSSTGEVGKAAPFPGGSPERGASLRNVDYGRSEVRARRGEDRPLRTHSRGLVVAAQTVTDSPRRHVEQRFGHDAARQLRAAVLALAERDGDLADVEAGPPGAVGDLGLERL